VNRSQRVQRLAVRMLYDEGFRARVLDGDEQVDAADRELLVAVDRRAWATDSYRLGRTLTAILTELPVTGALVGAIRALDFFRSPAFHAAIETRGSLVLAFGGWAQAGPIGELELATATLRRATDPAAPTGSIALGERFLPIAVPTGTLAGYESLRGALGSDPIANIGAEPRTVAPLGDAPEHLLLERALDGSIGIGTVGESLYEILASLLAGPRAKGEIVAHLESLGAAGEGEEILRGLLADGVLVTAP
jgi:hypothetical protein